MTYLAFSPFRDAVTRDSSSRKKIAFKLAQPREKGHQESIRRHQARQVSSKCHKTGVKGHHTSLPAEGDGRIQKRFNFNSHPLSVRLQDSKKCQLSALSKHVIIRRLKTNWPAWIVKSQPQLVRIFTFFGKIDLQIINCGFESYKQLS
jgi:hypothetical protein